MRQFRSLDGKCTICYLTVWRRAVHRRDFLLLRDWWGLLSEGTPPIRTTLHFGQPLHRQHQLLLVAFNINRVEFLFNEENKGWALNFFPSTFEHFRKTEAKSIHLFPFCPHEYLEGGFESCVCCFVVMCNVGPAGRVMCSG